MLHHFFFRTKSFHFKYIFIDCFICVFDFLILKCHWKCIHVVNKTISDWQTLLYFTIHFYSIKSIKLFLVWINIWDMYRKHSIIFFNFSFFFNFKFVLLLLHFNASILLSSKAYNIRPHLQFHFFPSCAKKKSCFFFWFLHPDFVFIYVFIFTQRVIFVYCVLVWVIIFSYLFFSSIKSLCIVVLVLNNTV